jgi:DNA invertase Pin-like site-specific DNA recombinase
MQKKNDRTYPLLEVQVKKKRPTAPSKSMTDATPSKTIGYARSACTFGYSRVSTSDQSTDLQFEELQKAGCDPIIRDDGFSGKNTDRPGLKKILEMAQAGDTIIVWKLDRLARSLSDLINLLDGFRDRGIEFRSLREAMIDTTTPGGRMIYQILGAFAEFERSMIRERTMAGQQRAKAKGVRLGRKPVISNEQLHEIARMYGDGRSYQEILRIFKIGRSTLVRALQGLRPASGSTPKGKS